MEFAPQGKLASAHPRHMDRYLPLRIRSRRAPQPLDHVVSSQLDMQHHAALNQWRVHRLGGERPEQRRKRQPCWHRERPDVVLLSTRQIRYRRCWPILAPSNAQITSIGQSGLQDRQTDQSRAPSEAGGGALIRSSTPVICSRCQNSTTHAPLPLAPVSLSLPFIRRLFSSPLLSFFACVCCCTPFR